METNGGIWSVVFCMSVRDRVLQRLRVVIPRCTEEAALVALALRAVEFDTTALIRGQLRCGAWTVSPSVGQPNAFHTALAILALRSRPDQTARLAAHRGLAWLAAFQPAESHWLWKWKFRYFDRQVRFDPDKCGWPWVPGTVSWVAPTALSMLAFRAWQFENSRLERATAMLLDRACPGGGWNAGNSVVFGVALDPHVDFTAMALLALYGRIPANAEPIRKALEYLANRLTECDSVYSLAWGAMALRVHHDPQTERVRERLEEILTGPQTNHLTPRVHALAALALENPLFTFQELSR
jgi:hypothetical protein